MQQDDDNDGAEQQRPQRQSRGPKGRGAPQQCGQRSASDKEAESDLDRCVGAQHESRQRDGGNDHTAADQRHQAPISLCPGGEAGGDHAANQGSKAGMATRAAHRPGRAGGEIDLEHADDAEAERQRHKPPERHPPLAGDEEPEQDGRGQRQQHGKIAKIRKRGHDATESSFPRVT